METVFVVLNYYELPHYYLNVFGGFSICFIITLYLQSYIFQFCSWHRVPIHYVLLSNIIALIDDIVKIPLGVSRATFDNYVRDGFIPKGIKQEGFKELSWQKSDLDIFLASKN